MSYRIRYSCLTHTGKRRHNNEDNFLCAGQIFDPERPGEFPLAGTFRPQVPTLIGVFDGMGGEACGEVASQIAASCARRTSFEGEPTERLLAFCRQANSEICAYAEENGISAMGTTAAMLLFTPHCIGLCNIGDSRIFRIADGRIEQITEDHVAASPPGVKPPLSQSLGIDPEEFQIEPYTSLGRYRNKDVYLLCSDGLTDMVRTEEILRLIREMPFSAAAERLQQEALNQGGKDNITVILCRVEKRNLLQRLFGK